MGSGDQGGRGGADEVLSGAARHYYEACLLYEDEDLDPDDALGVIRRAFLSSDCDDFAIALACVTGWEPVRFDWLSRDGEAGHHSLVRSPDGRLLDVAGWTDARSLSRRYGARRGSESLTSGGAIPQQVGRLDDDGLDEELARIVGVVRALPHEPYREPWFTALASRPVPGVDVPDPAGAVPGAPSP